jgi:hypothetical protein
VTLPEFKPVIICKTKSCFPYQQCWDQSRWRIITLSPALRRSRPSILCPKSYRRAARHSITWLNLNILRGIPEAADHGLGHVRSATGKDFDTGHSIRDAKIAYFPSWCADPAHFPWDQRFDQGDHGLGSHHLLLIEVIMSRALLGQCILWAP